MLCFFFQRVQDLRRNQPSGGRHGGHGDGTSRRTNGGDQSCCALSCSPSGRVAQTKGV